MSLQTLGGRKFLLTMATGFAINLLMWFGKIDASTFTLVTLGTVGAYITGNAYQRKAELNVQAK